MVGGGLAVAGQDDGAQSFPAQPLDDCPGLRGDVIAQNDSSQEISFGHPDFGKTPLGRRPFCPQNEGGTLPIPGAPFDLRLHLIFALTPSLPRGERGSPSAGFVSFVFGFEIPFCRLSGALTKRGKCTRPASHPRRPRKQFPPLRLARNPWPVIDSNCSNSTGSSCFCL